MTTEANIEVLRILVNDDATNLLRESAAETHVKNSTGQNILKKGHSLKYTFLCFPALLKYYINYN